ncbi:MAG: phosphoadenylyl-sulfate reductase [Bacteroidales bacterium]|jgi:phosphoadenosine phosphosulfate reductase|nr:phosphoadenylyl-sulfate reductase [Lentimicrobiaceae bacterium]MDG1136087.1 phosphoadenylyl-sulfate reductase [Bacteroidales bacterium]MDG1900793.1 phosphoadenylyl-sulfate reductase [Bacteroidales bacterium]MDG2080819.1 phosphoadenylyl-sulfate reductase [Bacteroidales bacterium]|tara:strand:+ start:1181 stop:1885 length:705 start_codon:yes stop_codon:yes gene_type:complete
MDINTLNTWNDELKHSSPKDVITFFLEKFPKTFALSTSLGYEDQVLTEMVASINKEAKIFTLDTGRLFPETYDLIDRTSKKYGINIHIYFPDGKSVEEITQKHGINLFYDSIENRKLCCNVRKIEPLARAMKDLDGWITGLRKDQSITRTNMRLVEWDDSNNIIKINPLINWTDQDVIQYIQEKGIPSNPLHKKGYASIGCQPCTRAIEKGENVRAGRWWWEDPETKECGLHIK